MFNSRELVLFALFGQSHRILLNLSIFLSKSIQRSFYLAIKLLLLARLLWSFRGFRDARIARAASRLIAECHAPAQSRQFSWRNFWKASKHKVLRTFFKKISHRPRAATSWARKMSALRVNCRRSITSHKTQPGGMFVKMLNT